MDQDSAPTGNTCFILSEVYEREAMKALAPPEQEASPEPRDAPETPSEGPEGAEKQPRPADKGAQEARRGARGGAYREGNFGWAIDRDASFRLRVGTEISFRNTCVYLEEEGEWKFVHGHSSIGVRNEELFGEDFTASS